MTESVRMWKNVDVESSVFLCYCPPLYSGVNCYTCTMTSLSVIGTDEVDVIRRRKPPPGKLNTPWICKIKVI